jgi:DNA polymerase-3 subunit beta
MKFVVSSVDLLNHLQTVNRVINPKNTLPILDNFLFDLREKELEITASDLETTMITKMNLENVDESGTIAVPARLLTDSLKEFPDQPLTFDINLETLSIVISTENGQFTIMGQKGSDFPQIPQIKKDKSSLQMSYELLSSGLNNTFFATADDELRPVMNGIFFELTPDNIIFVASDAHKLVRYKRDDAKTDMNSSFILPKKPASLLKNIISKDQDGKILVEFDEKNAFFALPNYKLVCRLVEGNYPSYNSVIPTDNTNKLIIDRLKLLNTLKRVSVFSNQASNLIKLKLNGNQLTVSAQDIDFSISAYERLSCQYEGDDMEIGFKSLFLIEILANLKSSDIVMELSDPSRAGLFLPVQKEKDDEDILMLLMPMMINA